MRSIQTCATRGSYRYQFDTSAATKLKNWLSWQITFSDRFLSDPLPGLKQNDLLLSTGVRLTFGRGAFEEGRKQDLNNAREKEEATMGLIYRIVVGLIAGWLAGKVMKGGGYGVLVDIVLGILGGIFGGWLFGMLGIWPGGGIIGSILVAFVGAVILVWITRLLKRA